MTISLPFHDGGRYHIETSFYMITASVMKRLITFSSSVALERVPNDWGLILHDFSTLFTQWSLNISRKVFASKMGWPFSVRTSFSKELISFIKKGLTKFQNALLQTFLGYYLKVYFYSNIFANTHNCSFFWIDASLACLVFHVWLAAKNFSFLFTLRIFVLNALTR